LVLAPSRSHLQRLAFDVPERHIDPAEPMNLLAARRVERIHVHVLRDQLGVDRVAADDNRREAREEIRRAAFANPGDTRIGLDEDDRVALVERRGEAVSTFDAVLGVSTRTLVTIACGSPAAAFTKDPCDEPGESRARSSLSHRLVRSARSGDIF
jgi:hypothetical protein